MTMTVKNNLSAINTLNQLDRNNERNFFPPLKLTRPLAVWQESKVSVTNFGFQPFQCVVSFRQERVVFF